MGKKQSCGNGVAIYDHICELSAEKKAECAKLAVEALTDDSVNYDVMKLASAIVLLGELERDIVRNGWNE